MNRVPFPTKFHSRYSLLALRWHTRIHFYHPWLILPQVSSANARVCIFWRTKNPNTIWIGRLRVKLSVDKNTLDFFVNNLRIELGLIICTLFFSRVVVKHAKIDILKLRFLKG